MNSNYKKSIYYKIHIFCIIQSELKMNNKIIIEIKCKIT